jgi:hypothetical protein
MTEIQAELPSRQNRSVWKISKALKIKTLGNRFKINCLMSCRHITKMRDLQPQAAQTDHYGQL